MAQQPRPRASRPAFRAFGSSRPQARPHPALCPPHTPRAGHETTFCALLYCLARLGVVGGDDAQALVLRVFSRYLALMRKIQVRLRGPPARLHFSAVPAASVQSRCAALGALHQSTLWNSALAPPPNPADHVLAGACWLPRSVGPGRLPLPALPLGGLPGGRQQARAGRSCREAAGARQLALLHQTAPRELPGLSCSSQRTTATAIPPHTHLPPRS